MLMLLGSRTNLAEPMFPELLGCLCECSPFLASPVQVVPDEVDPDESDPDVSDPDEADPDEFDPDELVQVLFLLKRWTH